MTATDYASRSARGGGLIAIGSIATMVVQFLSVTILSRLLTPDDFGLIAIVTVFLTLGNLLRDFGLPLAGLQVSKLDHQQASNLFWMSVAVTAVVASALALSTPLLVATFGEPRLANVVPMMASVVFIGGVTAQLQVQLARQMRFGVLVATDVGAQIVGLAVAVWLALTGAQYWALIAQALITASLTLITRWIATRWSPAWFRRGYGSRGLLSTGVNYGLAQLLTFVQANIATLIIGAQLGTTALGYYNRAYQLLTAPAARLLDPMTQVAVTALNGVKSVYGNPEAALLKIQFIVGLPIVWMFAVAGALSSELVQTFLGAQWSPAAPVFQVLAIGGAIWVFNHVSYWAFVAFEKSRELLRYNLVSKPIAIAAICVGTYFGIVGAAWGYVIAMAISWPLNLWWLSRTARLKASVFLRNGMVLLASGGVAAASVYAFGAATEGWTLLATLPMGAALAGIIMILVLQLTRPTRQMSFWWLRFLRTRLKLKAS